MSRYNNSRISKKDVGSYNKYETTIYENVPESNTDVYVITQSGDRLDLIVSASEPAVSV